MSTKKEKQPKTSTVLLFSIIVFILGLYLISYNYLVSKKEKHDIIGNTIIILSVFINILLHGFNKVFIYIFIFIIPSNYINILANQLNKSFFISSKILFDIFG